MIKNSIFYKVTVGICILCLSVGLNAQPVRDFIHPGVLHTQENFERMRRQIEKEEMPALESFDLLRTHKCSQADYVLQGPFEVIARDGEYRHTKSRMEQDFSAAYQNALMWMLTGEEPHARASKEILLAYAATLRHIPKTNDAPLLVGLEGWKIAYATEILHHTYEGFTEEHFEQVNSMLRSVFIPIMEFFYEQEAYTNGNWGPIVTKAYLAAAILWEDAPMYERAVRFYLEANDNGSLGNYISEDTGQIQESGRDQSHCMLGLGAMATVCEMAWQQGDDLYGALENRLLKGFEYVSRYNLGYEVPFTMWKDITGKYSNWPRISDHGRGRFMPVFEMPYNHYVRRMGMEMPFTKEVIMKCGPEGFDRDQPGFGSLLFCE